MGTTSTDHQRMTGNPAKKTLLATSSDKHEPPAVIMPISLNNNNNNDLIIIMIYLEANNLERVCVRLAGAPGKGQGTHIART